MEGRKKLLVYTPFKVGSSSLSGTMEKTFGIKQIWQNEPGRLRNAIIRAKPFILRGHTLDLKDVLSLPDTHFSAWITIIRKPLEMIPSCYFQDIDNPEYPYFFGTRRQVKKTKIQALREAFRGFEWERWPAVSYDFNFARIKAHTGLDLWQEPFDRQKGFMVHKSRWGRFERVGVIRIDKIGDRSALFEFFSRLGLMDKTKSDRSDICVKKNNQSRTKWYGRVYERFTSELGPDYHARFAGLNCRIEDHFF